MNKYHAIKTEYRGMLCDSKKEAHYYATLDLLKHAAEQKERVICWFPQVTFDFKCGVKYRADAVVCFGDGRWELHEVKSTPTKTAAYRIKRKMFACEYGVKIIEK